MKSEKSDKGIEHDYKQSPISYISHDRFSEIYRLSLRLPSWEIIGMMLDGSPITAQEFSFVMLKTRKGAVLN